MAVVAETPSLADFSPLVGEAFEAHASDGTVALTLVEALALPSQPGAPREEPFSLLFRAAPDCLLGQGTVRLEHGGIGTVDLFLVPMRPDQNGTYFEAVFN